MKRSTFFLLAKLSLFFLIPILFVSIIFLLEAFYFYDINPYVWGTSGRMIFVMFALFFTILGGLIAYQINDN